MNGPSRDRFRLSPFEAPDEGRLFAAFDENRARAAGGRGLVVIFAACGTPAARLCDEVVKLGSPVMLIEDALVSAPWFAARDGEIACVVFDMRHLASRGATSLPGRLRAAAPGPAIVLLTDAGSPLFPDPGSDPPAEVMLPAPATGTELRLGILSAIGMRRMGIMPRDPRTTAVAAGRP